MVSLRMAGILVVILQFDRVDSTGFVVWLPRHRSRQGVADDLLQSTVHVRCSVLRASQLFETELSRFAEHLHADDIVLT